MVRAVLMLGWLRCSGLAACLLVGASLLPATTAVAQDRAALTRVLRTSTDFRIRIQAAFALGNMGDPSAVPDLERGLRDRNPAVRAACATALGRLGSVRAIPALRRARNDRSAAVRMQVRTSIRALRGRRSRQRGRAVRLGRSVRLGHTGAGTFPDVSVVPTEDQIPWPRIRHAVVLGSMDNRSNARGEALTGQLREEIADQLRLLRGVAVLPGEGELDRRTRRELERRSIPTVRLNGAITRVRRFVRRGEINVRCEVALMLLDGDSDAIRGELRGAATGSAPRGRRGGVREQQLAAQALSAAVRSAMSTTRTALVRATHQ